MSECDPGYCQYESLTTHCKIQGKRIRELEDALEHIAGYFYSAEQCRELAKEALEEKDG